MVLEIATRSNPQNGASKLLRGYPEWIESWASNFAYFLMEIPCMFAPLPNKQDGWRQYANRWEQLLYGCDAYRYGVGAGIYNALLETLTSHTGLRSPT